MRGGHKRHVRAAAAAQPSAANKSEVAQMQIRGGRTKKRLVRMTACVGGPTRGRGVGRLGRVCHKKVEKTPIFRLRGGLAQTKPPKKNIITLDSCSDSRALLSNHPALSLRASHAHPVCPHPARNRAPEGSFLVLVGKKKLAVTTEMGPLTSGLTSYLPALAFFLLNCLFVIASIVDAGARFALWSAAFQACSQSCHPGRSYLEAEPNPQAHGIL